MRMVYFPSNLGEFSEIDLKKKKNSKLVVNDIALCGDLTALRYKYDATDRSYSLLLYTIVAALIMTKRYTVV